MSDEIRDPTEVDLYNLHIEFRDQGKLRRQSLLDVGKIADEARRKKSYMNYRSSKISLEYNTGIRTLKDGDGKDIAKPTVGAIKSAVDSDDEIYKLEEEYNDLLNQLDIANSFDKGISDKKAAIQGEIELWKAGYYAEPVEKVDNRLSADAPRSYIKEKEAIEVKQTERANREELKERRRRKKENEV